MFLTLDFISIAQKNKAAIIDTRKNSFVISAANAIKDHLQKLAGSLELHKILSFQW